MVAETRHQNYRSDRSGECSKGIGQCWLITLDSIRYFFILHTVIGQMQCIFRDQSTWKVIVDMDFSDCDLQFLISLFANFMTDWISCTCTFVALYQFLSRCFKYFWAEIGG